jgi:hypothetical protein
MEKSNHVATLYGRAAKANLGSLRHRWTARTCSRAVPSGGPRALGPAQACAGPGIRVSRPASAGNRWVGTARRKVSKNKNPPERRLGRGSIQSKLLVRLGEISPMCRPRDRERRAAALRSGDPSVQGQHARAHDFVADDMSARGGLLRAPNARVNRQSASSVQQR